MSEVGFEPTPTLGDQNTLRRKARKNLESGALDRSAILTRQRVWIFKLPRAIRSAPKSVRYVTDFLVEMDKIANHNPPTLRFGSLCEQHRKTLVSEVGFEPTPTLVDQNTLRRKARKNLESGALDRSAILTRQRVWIFKLPRAIRSAPKSVRYVTDFLVEMDKIANHNPPTLRFGSLCEQHRKTLVSEVGFEPTPTLVDQNTLRRKARKNLESGALDRSAILTRQRVWIFKLPRAIRSAPKSVRYVTDFLVEMDKIANHNPPTLRFGSLCEQHRKTLVSEVGFEPTPTLVDQNTLRRKARKNLESGALDRSAILTRQRVWIFKLPRAIRSAPKSVRYVTDFLVEMDKIANHNPPTLRFGSLCEQHRKTLVSEVGFEPTPTLVDQNTLRRKARKNLESGALDRSAILTRQRVWIFKLPRAIRSAPKSVRYVTDFLVEMDKIANHNPPTLRFGSLCEQHRKTLVSEVGFEPTPTLVDQNTLRRKARKNLESGALDRSAILTRQRVWIFKLPRAIRSAPKSVRYVTDFLVEMDKIANHNPPTLRFGSLCEQHRKTLVSEVGFEPTPTLVDQNTLRRKARKNLESGALDRSAILTRQRVWIFKLPSAPLQKASDM